jgi:archaellum component FlaD/FlaE
VIGFEDLDTGDDEPATEPPAHESAADDDADAPAAEQEAAATPEPDHDRLAASTAAPTRDPTPSAAPDTGNRTHDTAPADGGHPPMLETLPEGYAGEVLAMEWLGALIERSGPAGALRAVEHYEEVRWISPEVKRRLIDIIGGPSLDVFVDPMQPREPTGAEHQASYDYLTVLAELDTI